MRLRQLSVAACRLRPMLSARLTKSHLARDLGVPQQYLWNWLAGHSRPPERVRVALFERFKITPEEWSQVASRSMCRVALALPALGPR